MPGYPLLTLILGKDPVTGGAVDRNANNLIRGILSLIPGGEEKFQQLQQSKALDGAFGWFNQQIAQLNLTWSNIRSLFQKAWDSLSIKDLASPSSAFERVRNIFADPINRIRKFASAFGQKVLEFIFEGAMKLAGGSAGQILNILKRAGGAFMNIIRNPVAFVGNLVKSVQGGFKQFASNIATHLKEGLMGWLFGALAGTGLQLPKQLNLEGIVSLVLQIIGATYTKVRGLLVKRIGEEKVSRLEKAFEFVRMIATQGLAKAWQKITEFVGNLQEIVMGGIKEWVMNSVVTAAITKLISMFTPAGALVQAVIAIYNTIMFFVERAKQIAALFNAVANSISSIAAGAVSTAIKFIEQSMAKALPVIISFLERLVGLGNVSGQIRKIIGKIQGVIEKAINKLVDFIVSNAQGLLGKDRKGEKTSLSNEKTQKVKSGLTTLKNEQNKYVDEKDTIDKTGAEKAAAATKQKHPIFQSLKVVDGQTRWDYDYVVQRTIEEGKRKRANEVPGKITVSSSPLKTKMLTV